MKSFFKDPKNSLILFLFLLGFATLVTLLSLNGFLRRADKSSASEPTTSNVTQYQNSLDKAELALESYFILLSERKYDEAVKYHGSGYDYLIEWNEGVDPRNHRQLLQNGCEINGLICYKIKKVIEKRQLSSKEFAFVVQFALEDGTLCVYGPCCGFEEAKMPSETDFEFKVKKEGNRYLVVTQPLMSP